VKAKASIPVKRVILKYKCLSAYIETLNKTPI